MCKITIVLCVALVLVVHAFRPVALASVEYPTDEDVGNGGGGSNKVPTLHDLAKVDDASGILKLVNAGADPVARDDDGNTPVHVAIKTLSLNASRILIAIGALNVTHKNNAGLTPLHMAVIYGDVSVVQMIFDDQGKLDFEVKDNINASTPLMYAMKMKKTLIIEFLVGKNADIETTDTLGVRPFMIALQQNNTRLIRMFLKLERVNMNAKDSNNDAVIHYAAMGDSVIGMKYLLDKHIDKSVLNSQSQTPLSRAAQFGSLNVINLMLTSYGTPVCDLTNWNPLTAAAYYGQLEAVRRLIVGGAELEYCGPTTLPYLPAEAAAAGCSSYMPEMLKLLFNHYAHNTRYATSIVNEANEAMMFLVINSVTKRDCPIDRLALAMTIVADFGNQLMDHVPSDSKRAGSFPCSNRWGDPTTDYKGCLARVSPNLLKQYNLLSELTNRDKFKLPTLDDNSIKKTTCSCQWTCTSPGTNSTTNGTATSG